MKRLFLGHVVSLKYAFPDVNMVDLLSVFDFNLSGFLGPAFYLLWLSLPFSWGA